VLKRQLDLEGDPALFLERIGSGANQMLAMVNRLLESIDENTAIQLERSPCALEEVAQRAVRDLEGVALQKRISVKMRVEGEPYRLLADEERLYHTLLNLIENAIKYAPPETRVDVMIVFADTGVSVAVLDEGPGLAEEDLPRVFDKFYRGTRTLDKPGTGLGLAVVRHNVEAHDGSVHASNRKEKGAIFKMALPVSLRVADKPAPDDEAAPPV
jgi:two-component system sensor histidine kinase MprB